MTSPDIILHIGSGKTGTSTVQGFLHRNRRPLLRRAGVLFPSSPGRRRHIRLGLSMTSDESVVQLVGYHRQKVASPDELRRRFRSELEQEIADASPSRLLLSDEALFGSAPEAMGRLADYTAEVGGRVRLVCYLRRQDDHLISRYQQVVKTGETLRLTERQASMDFTDTYDYATRLLTWQQRLRPDQMVVRPFERDQFRDGSLLVDFLDAADIDLAVDSLRGVDSSNESLDAESVEFLRLLNLHLREDQGVAAHTISHQRIVRLLAPHSDGPVLTLPDDELDRFMARWEGCNARVARDLMGRADGVLFTAPRRSRNTTTVQHLDPARLPRLMELAEIAPESHEPLRRIAEREAAREAGGDS